MKVLSATSDVELVDPVGQRLSFRVVVMARRSSVLVPIHGHSCLGLYSRQLLSATDNE